MDRRSFLQAGAALVTAPIAALIDPAPKPAEDGVTVLSVEYKPKTGWDLNYNQTVTHLTERDAMGQVALGYHLTTTLPGLPNPQSVFEMRPWVRNPDGGWWESVPDPKAEPRYYLVGPARFIVKHNDVVVADSGEGVHCADQIDGEALMEWSKLCCGEPCDEVKLHPMIEALARHVTNAGYWRLFEIHKDDRTAELVLRWLTTHPKKGIPA